MEFDKEMYHTQEKQAQRLTAPIKTSNPNAWLGIGYYFWDDELSAMEWGRISKKRTGYYEIYKARICSDNILDTVFNRDHYEFWYEQIEKVATRFIKRTGKKPAIKEINDYFQEKASWNDVEGILFQDIPYSENKTLVVKFYYKKRIQLVVYKESIIQNFVFYGKWSC